MQSRGHLPITPGLISGARNGLKQRPVRSPILKTRGRRAHWSALRATEYVGKGGGRVSDRKSPLWWRLFLASISALQ